MILAVKAKATIKNWKIATEYISLIALIYYVAIRFYDSSRFNFAFFELPRKLTVSLPIAIVAIVRFVPCFIEEWKTTKNKHGIINKIVVSSIFVLTCLFVSYKFNYGAIAYIAIIPFCLYNISAEKVIKYFTATICFLLAATIICSLSGIIDNRINASIGEAHEGNLRGCYGIASATDLAAYFIFILSFFWCAQEKRRDRWSVFLLICLVLLIMWGIYAYTSTWTSIILCAILIGFIVYEQIEKKICEKINRPIKISKIVDNIVIWLFPFLGVLFYGLTWLYGHGNDWAIKINSIFHNRIEWAWRSFLKYGVHAFGSLTPQNGRGGDLISTWEGTYDFLDSTFALLLIRYGWILTFLVAFLWVWMTKKAIKNNKKRIAYTMAIIAIHCFSEHHFPELNYNVLLAIPFCSLLPERNFLNKKYLCQKHSWLPWVTGGCISGIVLILLPNIFSRMRTVFDINGWTTIGKYSNFFAFSFVVLCLGALVCIWIGITKLLNDIINRIKPSKSSVISIICSLSVLLCAHMWFSRTISTATANNTQLDADTPAINLIVSSAEQPIYASQVETLYKQRFISLSDRVDSPEALCRDRIGTVIVDKNLESYALLHTGAVYAEISDYSGIYSYDNAVISALKDSGYQVHGYYYSERELDLGDVAKLNNLEIDESGSILLLNGLDLIEEPKLSLYNGDYITTFDLEVSSETIDNIDIVCELEITTYKRSHSLKKISVSYDEFDENGHLEIPVSYRIKNEDFGLGNADVGFHVYPKVAMKVKKISYMNNPEMDTWRIYDEYNRLTEERYYDLSGAPISLPDGQFGVIYKYMRGLDSWVLCQYLNENGDVKKGNSGYAQIQRIYNDHNLMIEERFLDENEKLSINSSGYALCRREYDNNGNAVIYRYFGTNEEPILMDNGYAELHREYNDRKQKIKDYYFGTNGKPMVLKKGQAAVLYDYDDAGNINRFVYLDLDGNAVLLDSGYAELHCVYNDQKQIVREEYYDTEGKLVMRLGDYCAVEYTYNRDGNVIEERRYDIDGNIVQKKLY